jgi:hypothetical protein
MTAPSGHINGKDNRQSPGVATLLGDAKLDAERVRSLVAELEVPFDPAVIEWRVTNTAKNCSPPRGQVIPYADQRAYTDRLNRLVTPAGWTRTYRVHTSPNFERGKDKKIVAKVFVTCEVTIFGIGTHSATGEEWSDDENAATSAEAQAFKRSCACFGLGRYLYNFTGVWVDLDERSRPKKTPMLFGWATPEGWTGGQRPPTHCSAETASPAFGPNGTAPSTVTAQAEPAARLVRQIQQMQESLGTSMYRGLLRLVKAWKPEQIQDAALLSKTLERMQAAARGLRRLEAALEGVSEGAVASILKSLGIRFIEKIDSLETLHKLVVELEAAASPKR